MVAIVETSPAKLHHAHARPPKRHFASDPVDWFRGDQRAAKTAAALRFSTASTSITAMARPCCTRISPG